MDAAGFFTLFFIIALTVLFVVLISKGATGILGNIVKYIADILNTKKGPEMLKLTLYTTNLNTSVNYVFINPDHIVGYQTSVHPDKAGVTVVYTTFQAYPFEVTDSVDQLSNYLYAQKRSLPTPNNLKK